MTFYRLLLLLYFNDSDEDILNIKIVFEKLQYEQRYLVLQFSALNRAAAQKSFSKTEIY